MDKKELYNEWIEMANNDYEIARRMFSEHWPKQHINICYRCQQAAEKYLKGYLAYKEEEIIKTHILEDLLIICEKYDIRFNEIKDMCIRLTPFATQVRYPNNGFDITDSIAKKALLDAECIMAFIINKINE